MFEHAFGFRALYQPVEVGCSFHWFLAERCNLHCIDPLLSWHVVCRLSVILFFGFESQLRWRNRSKIITYLLAALRSAFVSLADHLFIICRPFITRHQCSIRRWSSFSSSLYVSCMRIAKWERLFECAEEDAVCEQCHVNCNHITSAAVVVVERTDVEILIVNDIYPNCLCIMYSMYCVRAMYQQ